MKHDFPELTKILLKEKLLTADQLSEALSQAKQTNRKLTEIIVGHGIATEQQILKVLSKSLDLPLTNLDPAIVDTNVVNLITKDLAQKCNAIPFFRFENDLSVAFSDPFNIFAIDAIAKATQCRINIVLASSADIQRAIDRFYSLARSVGEVVKNLEPTPDRLIETVVSSDPAETGAVKVVNLIMNQAIKMGVSDIHLEPDENTFRVRYRVDGVLQEVSRLPKSLQSEVAARVKIMAELDIAQRRLPQDGRFEHKIKGRDIDCRVSTLPTVWGEKIVLRLLDKKSVQVRLHTLGFQEDTYKRWRSLIHKPNGIVLITGPTGSGKTSTLYASLSEISSIEKNIVTVENPVEYNLPLINQVQINEKAGLTFATALRSILRQDPDIVMVGEIRDQETAEIAIRAALTGHLVFSTLHTNDSAGAIIRLVDMGIEAFLVASSIISVLSQRLIRRICTHCKSETPLSPELIEALQSQVELPKKVFKGNGCAHCNLTGYLGRTAVHELIVVDDDIRRMIVKGASGTDIFKAAQEKGTRSLRQDAYQRALIGETTLEEVLRIT